MAMHSYISTTFWDDAWVQEMDPSEKLVYMYLLTNPLINISGVYKITDRRICFDTGFSSDTIRNIMKKFTAAGKAVRFGEWVILPTWPKHQSLTNDNFIKGFIRQLQELPDDVFEKLREVGYRFDLESIPGKGKKKPEHPTGGGVSIDTDDWQGMPLKGVGMPSEGVGMPSEGVGMPSKYSILLESQSITSESLSDKNLKESGGGSEPRVVSEKPPPLSFLHIKNEPLAEGEKKARQGVELPLDKDNYEKAPSDAMAAPSRANTGILEEITDRPKTPESQAPPGGQPQPEKGATRIKTKIAADTGFSFDDDREFKKLMARADPVWFDEPYSLIAYIMSKIREKYANRPPGEQRKLFRKLLFFSPDVLEMYPGWRKKSIERHKQQEHEAFIAAVEAKKPAVCEGCGGEVVSLICQKCSGRYLFDRNIPKYIFHPPDTISLSDSFREILNAKRNLNSQGP
jgi:hypothetical protein